MKKLIRVILFFILPVCSYYVVYAQESGDSLSSADTGLKMAYIGNMGVLVEHNEKTVLFDGLHKKYKPAYLFPKATTVNELISGTYAEFSPLEIAFFSHRHGDHFDASYAQIFLKENPEAIIVGPQQIREEIHDLKGSGTTRYETALKVLPYDGRPHVLEHKGIRVDGIRCDHVNPSRHSGIQNMVYLVTMDDFRVVHMGDTDWALAEKPLKALQLKSKKIDILILPYWILFDEEAAKLLTDLVNPINVVATHIPPDVDENDRWELLKTFDNLIWFDELGKKYRYRKKGD